MFYRNSYEVAVCGNIFTTGKHKFGNNSVAHKRSQNKTSKEKYITALHVL